MSSDYSPFDQFFSGVAATLIAVAGATPDYRSRLPVDYAVAHGVSGIRLHCPDRNSPLADEVFDSLADACEAAWHESESSREPPTHEAHIADMVLAPQEEQALREYCNAWMIHHRGLLIEYVQSSDDTWEDVGEIFILAANGHDTDPLVEKHPLGLKLIEAARSDYRDPPEGFLVGADDDGLFRWARGNSRSGTFICRYDAVLAAWERSEDVPPPFFHEPLFPTGVEVLYVVGKKQKN